MPNGGNPGTPVRPYSAYGFVVRVDGVPAGHFTSCTGLEIDITPIAYREAGANQIVHYFAGPVRYSPVTLHYGLTDSPELWDWFMTGLKGETNYRNVTVAVLAPDGAKESINWPLLRAWPCRWGGVGFDTLSHAMAIESLTIAYAQLERDPPGN